MDQLTIRPNGPIDYLGEKGPTDYQSKMDELTIRAKWTNWLSGLKGPTDNQGKWNQDYYNKRDYQTITTKRGLANYQDKKD